MVSYFNEKFLRPYGSIFGKVKPAEHKAVAPAQSTYKLSEKSGGIEILLSITVQSLTLIFFPDSFHV